MSITDGWPSKPGVRIKLDLSGTPPEPANGIEAAYLAGLNGLRRDEVLPALEHFRNVVTQDRDGTYSTARLLALVVSAEVGDVGSLEALVAACSTNAQPDAFAQRTIDSTSLHFYQDADSDGGDIRVEECIDQPAITAQVALSGCLLALGQTAEAVKALEDGIAVWEARDAAWRTRAKIIAEHTGSRWLERDLVREQPPNFGLNESVWAKEIEKISAWRLRDRAAPRGPAGSLVGFDATLCRLYFRLEEWDTVLRYVDRYPRWRGSELTRAIALDAKGLPDAAVVVLDDYLRRPPDSEKTTTVVHARYQKARILLGQGDRQRARRELAKVYAVRPDFEDWRGLRAQVEPSRGGRSRTAISEDVRHAVWRRDEGRCAQCGSQENLEFDHIIPVSRGGANTERNLQLLCEPCNRSKAATV